MDQNCVILQAQDGFLSASIAASCPARSNLDAMKSGCYNLPAKNCIITQIIQILLLLHNHDGKRQQQLLSLFEAIFLSLIEQACFSTANVDYLWTSVSILFSDCTFFAVVSIWHARTTTHNILSLMWTIVAFITDTHQCAWTNIWVTDHTFTVPYLLASNSTSIQLLLHSTKCLAQTESTTLRKLRDLTGANTSTSLPDP